MALTQVIPPLFAQDGWYTASFIAKAFNRPLKTIQNWCRYGLFTRRGIQVIMIPRTGVNGGSNSYWIRISREKARTDAMFRGINLDIFSLLPLPSAVGSGEDASEGTIAGSGVASIR